METNVIENWLYSLLTSDATLSALISARVYARIAPQDAQFPYIVFNMQSGVTQRGSGAARLQLDSTYQVKVIGETTSTSTLNPVIKRVRELLDACEPVETILGRINSCVEEQIVNYQEDDPAGKSYLHLGGTYRIYAQAF